MVPSRDVLARIVTALNLPAEEQESLFDLLGQAAADAASNRGYGKGLTLLNQIADRERVCSAVSTFSNSIIPRLLQTAEYARDANRLTPWLSKREVGKAAAAMFAGGFTTALAWNGRERLYACLIGRTPTPKSMRTLSKKGPASGNFSLVKPGPNTAPARRYTDCSVSA